MPGPAVAGDVPEVPGFFGKLPTFPDFLSRRLPRSFLDPWDRWLQEGTLSCRERLGAAWLDTYLTSPIWRFVLAPDVCGPAEWTGVLMPSVDSVGRHFPLTLAAAVAADVGLLPMIAESGWYESLEEIALSTLDEPFELDGFDTQLQNLKPAATSAALSDRAKGAQNGSPSWRFGLTAGASFRGSSPAIAESLLADRLERQTFWWTSGSDKVKPGILTCKGLPNSTAFVALLDGNLVRWGWV